MSPLAQTETKGAGLAAVLFGKGERSIFAVLDGASAPGLVQKLFEFEPEYCCLYRGELTPDVATVAPYLVRFESGNPFTEWALTEGWGKHWGIFAASTADLRALRNHFREFHTVQLPDQRTVLFRYYDPRVLRSFLPACNAAELRAFFGPIESYLAEGEMEDAGVRFSLAGASLKSEPLIIKAATPQ